MNFNFKKKYGQNFLIDKNIVKKIVSLVEKKENSLVIEIGCGDGRLTRELCQNFKFVLGYEIDKELSAILENNLQEYSNCKIIFDDFLKRDIISDLDENNYENVYIIANLPYYITTPIIEKIIKTKFDFKEMIFMVQKEVGERFSAKVNSREYNSLTVYLNYFYNIKKEFIVNRNSFMPKPNIDSIVISFKSNLNKPQVLDEELFFKLVRDSFKYKRKNLKNNLKNYDIFIIEKVLIKHGFNLSVRAEQLNLEVFCDLANNLSKKSI